jgi:uncharacterized protein (DUF1684 family)
MKKLFSCFLLLAVIGGYSQDSYRDSMNSYLANYVDNHEVVTGDDKQFFSFYPVDANYRVVANFKKANNFNWFADLTSGDEKYTAGRYIDLLIEDIVDNKVILDFNKAYNPYCAYVSGKYNCPLPPRENQLPVAIFAGEKTFTKSKQE